MEVRSDYPSDTKQNFFTSTKKGRFIYYKAMDGWPAPITHRPPHSDSILIPSISSLLFLFFWLVVIYLGRHLLSFAALPFTFFFLSRKKQQPSGWAQLNHRREILIGAALLNLCGAGTSQFRPRSFSYPADYTHHNVFQKNGKKYASYFLPFSLCACCLSLLLLVLCISRLDAT